MSELVRNEKTDEWECPDCGWQSGMRVLQPFGGCEPCVKKIFDSFIGFCQQVADVCGETDDPDEIRKHLRRQ